LAWIYFLLSVGATCIFAPDICLFKEGSAPPRPGGKEVRLPRTSVSWAVAPHYIRAWQAASSYNGGDPCGQYISKKRPSRCVILSAAQDLVWVTDLVTAAVYLHRRPPSERWICFQWEHQLLPMATM